MSHINVKTSAIEHESAVTGGFSPVSVMDVAESEFKYIKNVVPNPRGDTFRGPANPLGVCHTSKFSFDAKNALFHFLIVVSYKL